MSHFGLRMLARFCLQEEYAEPRGDTQIHQEL